MSSHQYSPSAESSFKQGSPFDLCLLDLLASSIVEKNHIPIRPEKECSGDGLAMAVKAMILGINCLFLQEVLGASCPGGSFRCPFLVNV